MEGRISARDKIPHRPPMAMVDSILTDALPRQEVSAIIREDNRFLNSDGLLDRCCIPELVSQGAAAVDTLRHNGKCRSGMLALGHDIEVLEDIRVNDEIVISAADENPMDNWYVLDFKIYRRGSDKLCAKGEISLCVF